MKITETIWPPGHRLLAFTSWAAQRPGPTDLVGKSAPVCAATIIKHDVRRACHNFTPTISGKISDMLCPLATEVARGELGTEERRSTRGSFAAMQMLGVVVGTFQALNLAVAAVFGLLYGIGHAFSHLLVKVFRALAPEACTPAMFYRLLMARQINSHKEAMLIRCSDFLLKEPYRTRFSERVNLFLGRGTPHDVRKKTLARIDIAGLKGLLRGLQIDPADSTSLLKRKDAIYGELFAAVTQRENLAAGREVLREMIKFMHPDKGEPISKTFDGRYCDSARDLIWTLLVRLNKWSADKASIRES